MQRWLLTIRDQERQAMLGNTDLHSCAMAANTCRQVPAAMRSGKVQMVMLPKSSASHFLRSCFHRKQAVSVPASAALSLRFRPLPCSLHERGDFAQPVTADLVGNDTRTIKQP